MNKFIDIVFHIVLPKPNQQAKEKIQTITQAIIVMPQTSATILADDYGILSYKISVIQHDTRLVPHLDKELLKNKYNLSGKT